MRRWILAGMVGVGVAGAGVFMATRPVEDGPPPSFEDAPLRVLIDLSERHLYVESMGDTIADWAVAVGATNHPTPKGDFGVQRVIWNPRWVPPNSPWAKKATPKEAGDPNNPMGRVKIFFRQPTYYVHGTNAEESIGSAASHGCVRMRNEDVMALARLLIEETDAPVEPGLIQRLINRIRETRELRLPEAVPLRVQA